MNSGSSATRSQSFGSHRATGGVNSTSASGLSSFVYAKGHSILSIEKQVGIIADTFNLSGVDSLSYARNVVPTLALPDSIHGWFAWPKVDAVARQFFPDATDFAEMYCQSVRLLFKKLGASRKFNNARSGHITPDWLHRNDRTVSMLADLAKTQSGDILIVPSNIGADYAGRSAFDTRRAIAKTSGEFELGAFEIGCMLLTNPNLWEQLYVYGSGDNFYGLDHDQRFAGVPAFEIDHGELRFDTIRFDRADARYGPGFGFNL